MLRNHYREHDKKQLYKVKQEKLEINLELEIQLRLIFDQRPKNYVFHTKNTRLRTLKNSHTLATNKAENRCYENSNATDRDYSKSTTK